MKKLILLCVISLSACATITDGTSQKITVNTNPEGAECKFLRQEQVVAKINKTPGEVVVDKTKYDLTIKCSKIGYEDASYLNHSGSAALTGGNALIGGVIGWGIDSATGADNKYDSAVNITLQRH